MNRTFRLLRADEIEVRIGQVSKDGASRPWYSLLLYKDARCDMAVLDEAVGATNWTRRHYELKGVIYCSVGVRFPIYSDPVIDPETGTIKEPAKLIGYTQWVSKDDCGTESNTEKEKGESSDSFKRACVNWGIGRELYTAPKIFIGEDPKQVVRYLFVSDITYDDHGAISSVTIRDYKDANFVKVFANR